MKNAALILFLPLLLASCAEPVEDEPVEAYSADTLDDLGTTDPAAEVVGADGNVPSIAEVQLALAQCQEAPAATRSMVTHPKPNAGRLLLRAAIVTRWSIFPKIARSSNGQFLHPPNALGFYRS